ncbi:MAG: site-specific integrase [Desulfobacterales bacterium]|nr:site-specific integrase [Desulfobacterales bacterium]
MPARIKTNYPGVFYREAKRIGGKGSEKVFYIVFKKDGKLFEEKVGRQYVDDLTAARAATIRSERIEGKRLSRKEIREQKKAVKEAEANRWTFTRLWEKYKSGRLHDSNLSIDDGRFRKHLQSSLGDKEPGDLILLDVDRLRLKLLKKLSPQSVKHILNLLDRIVNFGVPRNLCKPLPFKIQKPQVSNTKTEDLTPEQLTALLNAIDADSNIHAANMMRMALFTGMRRGELFKLKWQHIDFHRGFIHIIDPKGGPDQIIPLNDAARDVLEAHPEEDSDFVFPGQDGKQRVTINVAVNRIKARAGLPKDFRPLHGLRHAYASMLASSGKVDLYHLQKLLTHKDPRMTQRYAHLRDEVLKKASNVAGEIIKLNQVHSFNAANEK